MPKVTMTFTLPKERAEHASALHGADWKNVVYVISMFLRAKLKYGHEYKTGDEALDAVKKTLWDECASYGLDPWED